MNWIDCKKELPPENTPVLIFHTSGIRMGVIRWEYPTFEEGFKAYQYWEDPYNDGQDWDYHSVTHWMHVHPPQLTERLGTLPKGYGRGWKKWADRSNQSTPQT